MGSPPGRNAPKGIVGDPNASSSVAVITAWSAGLQQLDLPAWERPRLESPSRDAGAILAADQAKAIRMHFLRDLTKAQLVEAFQEGFEANVKDRAPQKATFDKMLALVPDVKAGGTLTFAYLPGKGFADAVFAIRLGPKPPSEDLKKGLLG